MVKKKKVVPKKQANKKPSLLDKYKGIYKKDKFLWFMITVGVLVAIGLSIWGSIIYYEKQQFSKAEKALDSLYADIVAELGEPISTEKDKSCGYSSTKYGKGRLGCGIYYKIYYPATSNIETQGEASVVHQLIEDSSFVTSVSEIGTNDSYGAVGEGEQEANISFGTTGRMTGCSLAIKNTYSRDAREIVKEISFGCARDSRIEHFPVSD